MRAVLVAVVALIAVAAAGWFLLQEPPDPRPPGGSVTATGSPAVPPAPVPSEDLEPAVALRVLLLEPDMATPAPRRTVQVYSFVPRSMSLPEYVTALRTSDAGIAAAPDLPPGSYIVCAPGAAPGMPAPRTARVTVAADEAARAVLVEPPVAGKVTFDVRAAFEPRFGITPKLVLHRIDDNSGTHHEQPDLLKPGGNVFELELPLGRYSVGTLPMGELVPESGSREITIDRGTRRVTVVLAENPARVDVVLEGVPPAELPARVYPQPAADVLHDDLAKPWWGPHRWHAPKQQVPAVDGPRRVLVFGRAATFRSRKPVVLEVDRIVVPVEPATRIVVDWFDWVPELDAGALLTAEVGDEVIARTLVPRFGAGHPELERPALGGELVVPLRDSARLECRRTDGSLAWERVVPLTGEPVRLAIETPK